MLTPTLVLVAATAIALYVQRRRRRRANPDDAFDPATLQRVLDRYEDSSECRPLEND